MLLRYYIKRLASSGNVSVKSQVKSLGFSRLIISKRKALTNVLHSYKVKRMKTVTLSSKYQVVVPSSVRKKMSVVSGDRLVVSRVTANQVVFTQEPSFRELVGTAQKHARDPVERIRDLRNDWR